MCSAHGPQTPHRPTAAARTGGQEWVTAATTIAGRRDYVRLTFTPIRSAVYGQDNVGQGLGDGENRMTIASHSRAYQANSRIQSITLFEQMLITPFLNFSIIQHIINVAPTHTITQLPSIQ